MKLKEIKPGMVIHCKTEDEAKLLSEYGGMPDNFVEYWSKNYKENTCYYLECGSGWYFGKKQYYANTGKEITPFSSLIKEKTYEDGLNEAWEFVRKISNISYKELSNIFGVSMENPWGELIDKHSASEAISKLEAYEAEKQIKVGDVVKHTDAEFAVTCIGGGCIRGIDKLGKTHCYTYPNSFIEKTGKHIDISSILAEIGKE